MMMRFRTERPLRCRSTRPRISNTITKNMTPRNHHTYLCPRMHRARGRRGESGGERERQSERERTRKRESARERASERERERVCVCKRERVRVLQGTREK